MPTAAVSPPKLPGLKGLTGYGKTATEIVEDLAAQSEATAGERAGGWFVRMRDAGAVRGKLEKFIAEGPEQTQVVTDFDLTMTKMFLSNGAHGASSHAMFESYSGFDEAYRTDMQALFHKYYPIEKDPLVPHAEKMGHMNTWWETAHSRMLQQGLTRGVVKDIVTNGKDSKLALRQGLRELFGSCYEARIPVTVLSAGIYDIIRELLAQEKLLSPCFDDSTHETSEEQLMGLVSNRMTFESCEDNARHIGFDKVLVHSLTKKPALTQYLSESHVRAARGNVISMGDLITDVSFLEAVPSLKSSITIGFLLDPTTYEKLQDAYEAAFDIVVLGDGPMDVCAEIVQAIARPHLPNGAIQ